MIIGNSKSFHFGAQVTFNPDGVGKSHEILHSPPSLRHFVAQGLPPPVVVLRCGFSFLRVE